MEFKRGRVRQTNFFLYKFKNLEDHFGHFLLSLRGGLSGIVTEERLMGLSGYVNFRGILCNNNEQEEWTVYKYLSRGAVCDNLHTEDHLLFFVNCLTEKIEVC